jgi:hypothetical protein
LGPTGEAEQQRDVRFELPRRRRLGIELECGTSAVPGASMARPGP